MRTMLTNWRHIWQSERLRKMLSIRHANRQVYQSQRRLQRAQENQGDPVKSIRISLPESVRRDGPFGEVTYGYNGTAKSRRMPAPKRSAAWKVRA